MTGAVYEPRAGSGNTGLPFFAPGDKKGNRRIHLHMQEDAMTLESEITALRKSKGAVILAHTYQSADIQDIADFVGDSYGLSKQATRLNADLVVFCGVRFMAETAAILNPERTVVLPDPDAGCPMADMITADQLRELKARYPHAPVVCYVNSTAEVKAESTICCTSSNAVQIVNSLEDATDIIFVPDQYLGRFVEKQTGRRLILWEGSCPVHANLHPDVVRKARRDHPDAEVMVHPECTPQVRQHADHVLSTGQMCDLVERTECTTFIVGTEKGIVHTLQKRAPHITFIHLSPQLVCADMQKITMEKLRNALRDETPVVSVDHEIAVGARNAIQAMLDVVEG